MLQDRFSEFRLPQDLVMPNIECDTLQGCDLSFCLSN
jgi:hypothetical protein